MTRRTERCCLLGNIVLWHPMRVHFFLSGLTASYTCRSKILHTASTINADRLAAAAFNNIATGA